MNGSLRQRSPGSWELTIDTGRGALGRRERRYVTVRGTKAQAQRKLREFLSAVDKGIGLPPTGELLLRDWFDRWMAERITPLRRQRTKERYQEIIDRHIAPAIGHIDLVKLTPSHVQALEASLSKKLSAKGVHLVHTVLAGALKHALRMELIYRNPAALVSAPPLARREVHPPDIAVVRDALALAREEEHHLFACIHLIAYTGLRRGEALGLQWRNVDLDHGYLRIEGSLVRSRERGLILEPPKTESGRRTVDLDAGTLEVLGAHRASQGQIKRVMREAYQDHEWVFAGPTGEWINPMQLTRAVSALGRRVGHEAMTVRSLRHFHASVTLQAGQNIVVVSKRLGHASVSITSDIYAHALPGWQRQAADAFAEAMDPSVRYTAATLAPPGRERLSADQNADIPDIPVPTLDNRPPTD